MIITATVLSVSFSSCGDDDDSNEPDEGNNGSSISSMSKKLVGIWIDEDGDYSKFNSDGAGWMYASDEYGSYCNDFIDEYRISKGVA